MQHQTLSTEVLQKLEPCINICPGLRIYAYVVVRAEMPFVKSLRHLINDLPGTMTRQAKFNQPMSDCISLSVQDLFLEYNLSFSSKSSHLFLGREVCIFTVSICLPCTIACVLGRTVFWCFIGMPVLAASERKKKRLQVLVTLY